MSIQNTILSGAIAQNSNEELLAKMNLEKLLDRYDHSEKKYNLIIKKINIAQEQRSLVRDYKKTRHGLIALEEIQQIVSQGRSTKVNAPDDSDYGRQLSIMEKIAANLMGWLGLSSTGMSQESEISLSTEQRRDKLVESLNLYTSKIKTALESVKGDIDPELLEAIERGDPEQNALETGDES